MTSNLAAFYALQAQIEELTGLTLTKDPTTSESLKVSTKGYTNQSFELGAKIYADHRQMAVYLNINSTSDRKRGTCNRAEKVEALASLHEEVLANFGFTPVLRSNGPVVTYQITGYNSEELYEKFCLAHEDLEGRGAFTETAKEVAVGVKSEGTQFGRLKERGATLSPMFMKMVCDATGMSLSCMQAEYEHVNGGQIDGVEKENAEDPDADVISLFECQSGIHIGEYLDDEHANKIVSQYLYGDTHTNTVRKLVLLAGGFRQKHVELFREWVAANPGKEVYLLQTTRQDNKIGVEVVNLYRSLEEAPSYVEVAGEQIDVTDILDRLDALENEQHDLKNQLRAVIEKQNRPSLMDRLFKS